MSDKLTCPDCGKELKCLAGCSAHRNNWHCPDEENCGYEAWTQKQNLPVNKDFKAEFQESMDKAIARELELKLTIMNNMKKPLKASEMVCQIPFDQYKLLCEFALLHLKNKYKL